MAAIRKIYEFYKIYFVRLFCHHQWEEMAYTDYCPKCGKVVDA